MSLRSGNIPSLVQGVSQQPAALRLPTQLDLQENCHSSVVEGLIRRPPTEHIAKVSDTPMTSAFHHTINRDSSERYNAIMTDSDIQVFTIAGEEKDVTEETAGDFDYLDCDNPKTDLRAVTIADFTFVVNTTVTPAMDAATSAARNPEGLVFVKAGQYASTYVVYINGVEKASYTTSNTDVTTLATEKIADELRDDLVSNGYNAGGWTTTLAGSTIHITHTSVDFDIQVADSQGGASLKAFKDLTTRFSELPATAPDGFVIGIDANPDTLTGKYYLKAVSTQAGVTFGEVSWQESVAPGISYIIDPATMPHALVRQEDGTFEFRPIEWTNRIVGDDDTNSEPSFIGSPIFDIFFYKNRIGFLADEFFIMSETAEYFNFWRTTVTQLLDTDPIDSRAVNTKVSLLKSAVAFNTDLILFSDQTQFKIPGDVALTPKTIRCDPAAEFEGNLTTRPVNSGKSIYFIFNREGYAGLKDLFLAENVTTIMDASDLTGHVPAYIPAGVFSMSNSTLGDVTAILTDGDPSCIYVYKTAYQPGDNKKIQAAWYRWPMGDSETTVVLSAKFIESTLYMLIQRDGKVYQEKMILQPSRVDIGSTYITHLDRRIDQTILTVDDVGPSYDIETNQTLIPNLPYPPDEDTVVVTKAGQVLQIEDYDADSIAVLGDYSEATFWIGQKYLSRGRPSTIFVRKQTPQGGVTIDEASRLQLLRGFLNYSNTGYFKVSVTPEGRDQSDSIFTGQVIGDIELGIVALQSGRYSFGIFSKNDRVVIEISSDSFLPFSITSMEWEGNYTKRSGG